MKLVMFDVAAALVDDIIDHVFTQITISEPPYLSKCCSVVDFILFIVCFPFSYLNWIV